MLNFLVETKKEYTIQLINLIYYKIYQGIESIYQNSVKVSKEEDILKVFQKILPLFLLDIQFLQGLLLQLQYFQ